MVSGTHIVESAKPMSLRLDCATAFEIGTAVNAAAMDIIILFL